MGELRNSHIRISMTEGGDPKDNAQAERINSTVKNELLKDMKFRSAADVRNAVARAVEFYNCRRPHMSIGMMTPVQAALCTGKPDKLWKSYREEAIRAKGTPSSNYQFYMRLNQVSLKISNFTI